MVVVNVAVAPLATCWLEIAVVTTAGTHSVVQVGSLAVPVVGSAVSTGLNPVPVIVPWLQTCCVPAGTELLIVTWNIIVIDLPAGSVPRLWLIVSPDCGVRTEDLKRVPPLPEAGPGDFAEATGPTDTA